MRVSFFQVTCAIVKIGLKPQANLTKLILSKSVKRSLVLTTNIKSKHSLTDIQVSLAICEGYVLDKSSTMIT